MKRHRHIGKYKSRTPKGRTVYKRRPKHRHTLKKEQRKIFQRLDQEPIEYGGYMDFNDLGLERADVYVGEEGSVDIDITPDKEIDYHTHNKTNNKLLDKLNYFPSKEDIMASKEIPSQTMLIFHNGKVTVASKRKNYNPKEKDLDKLESGLVKDANILSVEQLFKKYKPHYKKVGVDLKHVKHKGSIKIPFSVVEPNRATLTATRKGFFDSEGVEDFKEPDLKGFFADDENYEAMDRELTEFTRERDELAEAGVGNIGVNRKLIEQEAFERTRF